MYDLLNRAWISHKGIRWYFNRQIVSNSEKSVELRKRKKKILEEVMDTETYKVAKEILDRFGDKPQNTPFEAKGPLTPTSNLIRPSAPGTELRHRQVESSENMPQQSRIVPPLQSNTPANMANANKMPQTKQQPLPPQPTVMLSTQRYKGLPYSLVIARDLVFFFSNFILKFNSFFFLDLLP